MNEERRLVVVGAGFAGVWAALAAARHRRAMRGRLRITVVSPDAMLGIRPRFHEDDLARSSVPLSRVLGPVEVEHVAARVLDIDVAGRSVVVEHGRISYDALVLATGSAMVPPRVPGAELVASVDTLADAVMLRTRLAGTTRPAIVVVGAGFTGIEVAAELVARAPGARIVLVERAATVAPDFGPRARASIAGALADLGIATRTGSAIATVATSGVTLENGEVVPADVVVWTAGLHAGPLGATLGAIDELGRVSVDAELRARDHVWVAGDAARTIVDGVHVAPMSCQHAMPQGRIAGHNAACALLGGAPVPYAQHLYVTCLDLGPWGALVTRGFARDEVVCAGAEAKIVKRFINASLIYPPLDDADRLLAAARPHRDGRMAAAILGRLLGVGFLRRAAAKRGVDGPGALDA